jgi:hypothetical protein
MDIGYTYWHEDVKWRSQFLFQVSVVTYRQIEMLRTMQIVRRSAVSVGIVSGLYVPEALRILRNLGCVYAIEAGFVAKLRSDRLKSTYIQSIVPASNAELAVPSLAT